MKTKNILSLQKKYPKFIYQDYYYKITKKRLKLFFNFRIEPDIRFRPTLVINNIDLSRFKKIKKEALNNLIFHLGLMEIPTYWKTTCSPQIIIRAGSLTGGQIKWWQDLLMRGMGQFFYENNAYWQAPRIVCCNFSVKQEMSRLKLKNRYLVPLGGGKDSIVTLEKLLGQGKKTNVFAVNANPKIEAVIKKAGIKNPIKVERKIDPNLLELNKKGYLNGHTPFTAVLSFSAVFCAILFDYKNVVFSNEKSADQGNLKYLGKTVNHQWAKSSEFERKFKKYIRNYLTSDVQYSSYLRKYSELEIAKMFVKYPKYFHVFSSCNRVVAERLEKNWCGDCPKCLFAYLILCPYLAEEELLRIFGKNLLEEPKLLPVLKSLVGRGEHKPFECVGTYKESRRALEMCFEKKK